MGFKYASGLDGLEGVLSGTMMRVSPNHYLKFAQITPTLGKLFRECVLKQLKAMRRIPPDRWLYSGGMFKPRVSYNRAKKCFDVILAENKAVDKQFRYWRVFEKGRRMMSDAQGDKVWGYWGQVATVGGGRRGDTVRRLFYKRTRAAKYFRYKKSKTRTGFTSRISGGTAQRVEQWHKQVVPAEYSWYYDVNTPTGGTFERAVPMKKRMFAGKTEGTDMRKRNAFGMVHKFTFGRGVDAMPPRPFANELAKRVLAEMNAKLAAMGWGELVGKLAFGGL